MSRVCLPVSHAVDPQRPTYFGHLCFLKSLGLLPANYPWGFDHSTEGYGSGCRPIWGNAHKNMLKYGHLIDKKKMLIVYFKREGCTRECYSNRTKRCDKNRKMTHFITTKLKLCWKDTIRTKYIF